MVVLDEWFSLSGESEKVDADDDAAMNEARRRVRGGARNNERSD